MWIFTDVGFFSIVQKRGTDCVTVDIYGHLAPQGNKQAVDRLDDATNPQPIRNQKKSGT